MTHADVKPFGRSLAQLPVHHRSCNDDVKVEAYAPPKMAYAGKQRKGVRGNFRFCSSLREHAQLAVGEQFPFSAESPLPRDTLPAAVFSRDFSPGKLRAFWNSHLPKVEHLVTDTALAHRKWGAAIPGGIKPAAGKLKTVAISQLIHQYGIHGKKWIRQFPTGFPRAGELSQRHAYQVGGKRTELPPRAHL